MNFDGPYNLCTIEIKRDEHWSESVIITRLNTDGSQSNFDFSTITKLELFIRPLYDNTILLRKLSSLVAEGNEIRFDPLVPGVIQFFVTRDNVASLPIGKWQQFLVATYSSTITEEFWRGPFIVHPGRTS